MNTEIVNYEELEVLLDDNNFQVCSVVFCKTAQVTGDKDKSVKTDTKIYEVPAEDKVTLKSHIKSHFIEYIQNERTRKERDEKDKRYKLYLELKQEFETT